MTSFRKVVSTSRRHAPGAPEAPSLLARVAAALDRMAPAPPAAPDMTAADAFVWHAAARRLAPVVKVNRVEMTLLRGIDRVRDTLADDSERFARRLPANNALLSGAHGMGKSCARQGGCTRKSTRGWRRPRARAR